MYGIRACSNQILTREPMGISARYDYVPGNWNFAGILPIYSTNYIGLEFRNG